MTKSVNKNSKGKQKHHKVSALSMNIESSGNFRINKQVGLKSLNSKQLGHVLEKKARISYEQKGTKKAHFFHFQGAHFFHATLMLIY